MTSENPPLCYFVQEDTTGRILFHVKTDATGLIRWEIPKAKAADLAAELSRMVAVQSRVP